MDASKSNNPYVRYGRQFTDFFLHPRMASTYKPVFVRSLADIRDLDMDNIGRYSSTHPVGSQWIRKTDDGKIRLELDFIAIRLAKYYWDLEVTFQLRHMPEKMADHNKPKKDNHIVRMIKEMCMKNEDWIKKPPTLEELASDDMIDFRKQVIKTAMDEVLDHLPNNMPDLYTWKKGDRHIVIDVDLIYFMKEFADIIKIASCYLLALKLEQVNDPDTDTHMAAMACGEISAKILAKN